MLLLIKQSIRDFLQTLLLMCFKYLNFLVPKISSRKFSIIGIDYSNILYNTGKLINDSYTVNLVNIPFFSDNKYDFDVPKHSSKILANWYLIIYRPFILARLVKSTEVFIYIGKNGMCFDILKDLRYLKHFNKKIITMFIGSDIRSPYLLKKFMKEIDMDYFINYLPEKSLNFELEIKRTIMIAEKYSEFIISSKIDQMSYYTKEPMPFLYYMDSKDFSINKAKFNQIEKIKILHSPTSYAYKGTPLVRAAIKKLKLLGYEFEYIELQGVKHSELLKIMSDAHIVLAEFYSFLPGITAIEALHSFCTVLTSANHEYETFPEIPTDIWIQTGYWEIFDKLKFCLDNKDLLPYYAENGLNYANRHYSIASAQKQFLNYCSINNLYIKNL